jgi:hypothetical protein
VELGIVGEGNEEKMLREGKVEPFYTSSSFVPYSQKAKKLADKRA